MTPRDRPPVSGEPSTDPHTEPRTDPVLGDNGYPHEDELQRIREWPWEGGFRSLMAYVRERWQYADAGYWDQQGDRFAISTAGWSGNESIIGALEANQMFSMLCPVSWRTGGHYVYDVQDWDDNPEPGKRKLIRDPATPMHDSFRVAACDCEAEATARADAPPPLDVEVAAIYLAAAMKECGYTASERDAAAILDYLQADEGVALARLRAERP